MEGSFLRYFMLTDLRSKLSSPGLPAAADGALLADVVESKLLRLLSMRSASSFISISNLVVSMSSSFRCTCRAVVFCA